MLRTFLAVLIEGFDWDVADLYYTTFSCTQTLPAMMTDIDDNGDLVLPWGHKVDGTFPSRVSHGLRAVLKRGGTHKQ